MVGAFSRWFICCAEGAMFWSLCVSSITVDAVVTQVDKAEAFTLAAYLPEEMHENRYLAIWYKIRQW